MIDETPVPLVDLDRLDRNLDRMADYAAQHHLSLRPHTKTHKSSRIAAEQLRRGAVGLTCATLLEMEHVCAAVHLHEVIYGHRGDRIETSWPVTARSRRSLGSSIEV